MSTLNREAILEAVRQLPQEEQRELAHEILKMTAAGSSTPASGRREPPAAPDPRTTSAVNLRGIARTDTPIDDARLLDESRMDRYG